MLNHSSILLLYELPHVVTLFHYSIPLHHAITLYRCSLELLYYSILLL